MNDIFASCSGALPIVRRKAIQRGSPYRGAKRGSATISTKVPPFVALLLEPLERAVGLAAERVEAGDVVGHVLLVLRDQPGERGVGLGLTAERVVGHGQANHAEHLDGLLLELRERTVRVAFEQHRDSQLVMRDADC